MRAVDEMGMRGTGDRSLNGYWVKGIVQDDLQRGWGHIVRGLHIIRDSRPRKVQIVDTE